jgi:stalled ribosome rescue protein Dom34
MISHRKGRGHRWEEEETKMTNSAQVDQLHRRAVVWIDHLTAKIFAMGLNGVSASAVHAHLSSSHLHHRANTNGSGHARQDPAFFSAVAKAVGPCDDVLILGPGIEKTALMHYLQSARPEIALRLESSDHPTDEEVIAMGRKHFGLAAPRA